MNRLNSSKAYSEIYEILNILGEDYLNKIPKKLLDLIDKERDRDYKPDLISEDGLLDENKIGNETIALFGVLNMKYFIQDDKEKEKLWSIYEENEIKYQKELREKYNKDTIFKKSK